MKFVVVLVAAGAAAFLGALICILASVYPPRGRGAPPGAVANGNSVNGTLGSESPLDALGAPGAVAHAGPLGALQGGGSYDGGNGLGVGPEVPAPGPGDVVVPGAGGKRVGFSRLICTPVPVGGCGRPQADDPWSAAAADADADSAFLRTTADELRRMVAQQDHQILMDQRTIRELTGKLSECESGLEDQDVPERSVGAGGGGGAWSSSRRFMAGDDVSSSSPSSSSSSSSSSSAAATAAQLQTARAVEELERAIMDLKDRIEKLEAEIGPAAFNLTDASAGASSNSGGASHSGSSGGVGASGPVSAGSSSSSSSKTSSSPPASPGASGPGAPGSGGRRPAARPPAARPPAQQGGGAGGRGGKGTWKVGDLEGELERKIKLLEKERQTMRKESQGHRDNIDKGLDAVDHRLAELEHTMTDLSFPDGFVVYFPIRTNYMYGLVRREMPEMYAFTACLWLKTKEGGIGTPFSYSVPGQPNELVLLQGVHNPVELLINDKVAQLPLSLLQDEWQHVCVSWTLRDGVWKAYQGGKMKGRGEGLAAWHPIKPGGVLILGQEQDTLGGRFDASQALVGELSQFNLWDRVLRPAEVASLADCSSSVLGNVAPWTDLDVDVFEGATKESLDPCHAAQRTNPKGHKQ